MCGIAGALFFDRDHRTPPAVELTRRMADALAHRGPDGRGIEVCSPVDGGHAPEMALGHTRLAILDLSERGAQPMKSSDRSTWITFNGEIYNFKAIRRDLEAMGRSFRSDSDTEVVLQGYEQWGDDIVRRLRGIFAFAIWDGVDRRLLLARDHLGVKPLYVFRRGNICLFASEVRALLATGIVPRIFDRQSISEYLRHQTVAAPRTLVRDVSMLLPGHTLVVSGENRIVERKYWDLLDDASTESRRDSPDDARARVKTFLEDAVALNLVSDVPVGVFLSGGIDSSAIVALTRRAGVTPRTLSVTLPGTSHDESSFSRHVARRFEAEHTEIPLQPEDFRDRLPAALASLDHPSGDGLNTFVVAQAARAGGLKVALSGLGGDELFGGYPSFGRLRKLADYGAILRRSPAVVRGLAAAAVRGLGRGSVAATKTAAVLESDGRIAETFPVLRELFTERQRAELLGPDFDDNEIDPYAVLLDHAVAGHPQAGTMTMVSFAEARTYMHDVLLRDTDQMSMAHGLEVRVPLLDHRVAEYVMGLDDETKIPREKPKQLLVESLDDLLPNECVMRPKQGFVLPFDAWMKRELRDLCEHHLGPRGIASRAGFQVEAQEALWRDFLASSKTVTWSRPWALVALSAWAEQQSVSRD